MERKEKRFRVFRCDEGCYVESKPLNFFAKFYLFKPPGWNHLHTKSGAQDISGDRSSAVTITRMVDCEHYGILEVLADEATIERALSD